MHGGNLLINKVIIINQPPMEASNEQTTITTPIEQTITTTPIATTTIIPISTTVAEDPSGGANHDNDNGPKDITYIAKGKRTKRQRPQSPIQFTFSSTNNNDLTYSPMSSSNLPAGSTTTEDEDTAESLILLSKGQSSDLSTSKKTKDDYDGIFKFNSKKYIAGNFVYECRTCSRTFPSFQALGGHRASHKKPKYNEDIQKPPPYTYNNEVPPPLRQQEYSSRNNNYTSFSYLYSQLNSHVSSIRNTMKSSSSKLHECSICGTEFNSGQALGGHMRRHRVVGGGNKANNNTNNNTLALVPYNPVTTMEVYDEKTKNDELCLGLSLDLNLPAPRETTATTGDEKKQQPDVHLPATPTLVDCHY